MKVPENSSIPDPMTFQGSFCFWTVARARSYLCASESSGLCAAGGLPVCRRDVGTEGHVAGDGRDSGGESALALGPLLNSWLFL